MYILDFDEPNRADIPVQQYVNLLGAVARLDPSRPLVVYMNGFSQTDAQTQTGYTNVARWYNENYGNSPTLPILVGINWDSEAPHSFISTNHVEASARATGQYVGDMLAQFQATNTNSINICAHSMGNILAMSAIDHGNNASQSLQIDTYLAIQATVPTGAVTSPNGIFHDVMNPQVVNTIIATYDPTDIVVELAAAITLLPNAGQPWFIGNWGLYDYANFQTVPNVENVLVWRTGAEPLSEVDFENDGDDVVMAHHDYNPYSSPYTAGVTQAMMGSIGISPAPWSPIPVSDPPLPPTLGQ